jgi:uncharacterized membrane protein
MVSLGGAAGGALITAFVITLVELTEVVAIVYALGASSRTLGPGFRGAVAGVALVGVIGLAAGATIAVTLGTYSILVGSVMLWAFGVFLLRSTLRTYLREDRKSRGIASPKHEDPHGELTDQQLFSLGFSVGGIEALEAVIVLIAISAGGFPAEAIVGAVIAGAVLVLLGSSLHQQIRKIKVPALKWVTTSLLFTYAIFWTGEALGNFGRTVWPTTVLGLPDDVLLIPIYVVVLLIVRAIVGARVHVDRSSAPGRSDGNPH